MAQPPRTDDGHHVVIDGRRWRATDPAIPEERRAELVRILMAWRREVRRTKGTDGEAAALLAGPLPEGVAAADVAKFLARWNRSLAYWDAGVFTACGDMAAVDRRLGVRKGQPDQRVKQIMNVVRAGRHDAAGEDL